MNRNLHDLRWTLLVHVVTWLAIQFGPSLRHEQNYNGPNLAANHGPIIKTWLGH